MTSRSGKQWAMMLRAWRSLGSLKVGTRTPVVGDVEVGVAGGEALAFEEDGRGHGEFDDLEGLACEVADFVEAVEVFGQGEVVFVGGCWARRR